MNDIEWQGYIWNQQECYDRGFDEHNEDKCENPLDYEKSNICYFDDRLSKSEDLADVEENASNASFFTIDSPDEINKRKKLAVDRSFIKEDLYIGYDEGIDPTTLDLIEHLQFEPGTASENYYNNIINFKNNQERPTVKNYPNILPEKF